MSLLLLIIYLTLVSFGLPDSAVGAAWPSMYVELGAGVSWQGIITLIIGTGTIVSSLLALRLVRYLSVFRTIIGSVALTALALIGFSTVGSFWQICLWAIPYVLGADAIDAALNAYASIHYAARHMSWLRCIWDVGASTGPLIMAACLAKGIWHLGFLAIGIIQFVIVGFVAPSHNFWARATVHDGEDRPALAHEQRHDHDEARRGEGEHAGEIAPPAHFLAWVDAKQAICPALNGFHDPAHEGLLACHGLGDVATQWVRKQHQDEQVERDLDENVRHQRSPTMSICT